MATASATEIRGVSTTRSRVLGIMFLVVAAGIFILWGLGSPKGADSTFVLNPVGGGAISLPDLVLPSRETAYLLAGVCAFLGGVQLTKGFGKRSYIVLGAVVFCFVAAFMIYAAADRSLNLVGMLESTLLRSVPITFGALAGVLCERSGVINIAIEGMLLTSAFTGSIVGSAALKVVPSPWSLWIGLLGGALVGAFLGWFLGVLSIRYQVNQIIGGTVINIFALGITGYLSARVLSEYQDLNNPGRFAPISIPILSKIPVVGPVFFDQNVFVYIMYVLVAGIYLGLFYTRWGLRVRAVGEHPRAADTVGIRVLFTRYRNVILGGMVAGIGGAYFTLGSVGRFDENMTAGRGFIGLAAMIFGRWNPVGAFAAALVFGFADSLQTKLSILQVNIPFTDIQIPSEFLLMAPYLVTIFVVAGVVRKARPPAADGMVYTKE